MWMLLVLFYGVVKGAREAIKKKALEKNSVIEVLVVYTLLSFIICIPQVKDAGGLVTAQYLWIALKSFCIFIAWICSFKAIDKLPISMYGVLDLSRVLFATSLGVLILGETMSLLHITGLLIVLLGLVLLKFKPSFIKRAEMKEMLESGTAMEKVRENTHDVNSKTWIYVLLAFTSCILNAVSGTMDKILMRDMNSSQLQFWYMLFLTLYYVIYVLVTCTKIRFSVFKNGWIWLLAVLFVAADKALFIANADPSSRVTVMTLIKQTGTIVTILAGKFVFKEKHVGYRLFCALVIVSGIILGTFAK
ncbi:MAG: EamA family transporter [Lachnospiraceae bacterium]|nr:EamA family transporter [Lachnospiraceae bacterium]